MKVLAAIVVPPHMSVSGGARAGEQLSHALAPFCDITVANMMDHAGEAAEGGARRVKVSSWLPPLLPWSRLPRHFSTLFYRSDIPKMVRSGSYDIVHIHNPMPALELERIARACLSRGVPYVISTHGFNEVANGTSIYGFDFLRRQVWQHCVVAPLSRALRNASAVFALSPADFAIVRSMGFRGDLAVVPNGVPKPLPGNAEADHSILKRLGIPGQRTSGQITCMFLANHTPNKGLPDLFKAFARLEVPFLLIVGGEQRDKVDYQAMQDACRPGQQVVFTGRLQDEDISTLYRRSDLFVFPTLADTFPLVVLEAMAHGVPVVATRVGGIPHQVTEDCGVLVPPGDHAALAQAISNLASNPVQLGKLAAGARARADEFSWEQAAGAALEGYRAVMGRSSRDRPLVSAIGREPRHAG